MTTIAGTNIVMPAFRNASIGITSNYTFSTVIASLNGKLCATFEDNGTTTPDNGHIFMSSISTALNPVLANSRVLQTVTQATTNTEAAAGKVDADDPVFSSGSSPDSTVSTANLAGAAVESFVVFINISAFTAASCPIVAHYGSATGLTGGLTPNDAAVTVVLNTSGLYGF